MTVDEVNEYFIYSGAACSRFFVNIYMHQKDARRWNKGLTFEQCEKFIQAAPHSGTFLLGEFEELPYGSGGDLYPLLIFVDKK